MWSELALAIQKASNVYLITILVISAMALVIIFERFFMLQFVFNMDFKKFLLSIKKMVLAEDNDRAINLCKSISASSLPLIAQRALEAAETDPTTVRGTIEEETLDFIPKLETRLTILPVFATIILLVGILGTIDSLWEAFNAITVVDTAKKQGLLSQGLASSLNTTAIGLVVCMVILTCYHLLKGMAVKITDRIHYGVTVLTNILAPPEFASYMPVSEGYAGEREERPTPTKHAASKPEVKPAAQPEEGGTNDTFADASVEDIKDEEEII